MPSKRRLKAGCGQNWPPHNFKAAPHSFSHPTDPLSSPIPRENCDNFRACSAMRHSGALTQDTEDQSVFANGSSLTNSLFNSTCSVWRLECLEEIELK